MSTTTTDFLHTTLGRTGRRVHRLGVAASYGVGGADLEAAVEERGVSYLYWGSKRTRSFGDAIRALCARGRREDLFVVIQSYSRLGCLVRPSLQRALKSLKIEQADMLLLGWWNKPTPPRIVDAARACQERGLTRHLGISTHQRPLVPGFLGDSPYDVVHCRYNAANRGAERDIFEHMPVGDRAGLVVFTATRWGQLLRPPANCPPELAVPSAGDCYRFALSNDDVDVCMSGPANGQQLREALDRLDKGPLDPDELAWMRRFGDLVYGRSGLRQKLGESF